MGDRASATANLRGRCVIITRPAGTATALAARVRQLGGVPLLLPGLSLRAAEDAPAMRSALRLALRDDLLIFTSPAAVRYAAALLPLRTRARVFAVGQGTARRLARHGLAAQAPRRQDSEGLLDETALGALRGRRVALIGAAGGRGLLREQLAARGAVLRELHVYRRTAPRLDRRHFDALARLPAHAAVLLSSAEALGHLSKQLPEPAWRRLLGALAVVSSERLRAVATQAGFARIVVAASALPGEMLAALAGSA